MWQLGIRSNSPSEEAYTLQKIFIIDIDNVN